MAGILSSQVKAVAVALPQRKHEQHENKAEGLNDKIKLDDIDSQFMMGIFKVHYAHNIHFKVGFSL